jgi:hypothetical protein
MLDSDRYRKARSNQQIEERIPVDTFAAGGQCTDDACQSQIQQRKRRSLTHSLGAESRDPSEQRDRAEHQQKPEALPDTAAACFHELP